MNTVYRVVTVCMVSLIIAAVLIWLGEVLLRPAAQERRKVRMIEQAMGFRLYEWQKEYILRGGRMPEKARGKTTAFIIRMLLAGSGADIILLSAKDVWAISEQDIEKNEDEGVYCEKYLRQVVRIWQRLFDAGVIVRNVIVRPHLLR